MVGVICKLAAGPNQNILIYVVFAYLSSFCNQKTPSSFFNLSQSSELIHARVSAGCKYACHAECRDKVSLDCHPATSPVSQDQLNNNTPLHVSTQSLQLPICNYWTENPHSCMKWGSFCLLVCYFIHLFCLFVFKRHYFWNNLRALGCVVFKVVYNLGI